jgi:SAM-dependent methyltransferase
MTQGSRPAPAAQGAPGEAVASNRAYYQDEQPGREDYWRKMAAPRFRVRTLLSQLQKLGPRRVVDLGCGNGRLLAEVGKAFPRAERAGFDLSSRQVEVNRRAHPECDWVVANLEDALPPSEHDGRYDALLATEIVEHLDRPERFVANARQLAAPGGHLILTTQSGPVRETERRVGHRRHYEATDMRRLLASAGWQPVRVWNAGFPFHDLSKWYANLDPDGSMTRFSDTAYGLREDLICLALRASFRLNSRRRGAQLFIIARC